MTGAEFLSAIANLLSGEWVDTVTLIVAIAFALYRCRQKRPGQPMLTRETGSDVIHGLPLFPLLLLIVAVPSNFALNALLHSHKVILGAAGVVAFLAILNED